MGGLGSSQTSQWKSWRQSLASCFQVRALTSNSCSSLEPGNLYNTNLLLITLNVLLLPERLYKITLLS